MWVTKLLISPVKKRIFCPKTTKFGPKLAFLVNLGQAMQASSVPCQWVGWWLWRAGCISQDTYLLYFIINHQENRRVRYVTFSSRCPTLVRQIEVWYYIEFNSMGFHLNKIANRMTCCRVKTGLVTKSHLFQVDIFISIKQMSYNSLRDTCPCFYFYVVQEASSC